MERFLKDLAFKVPQIRIGLTGINVDNQYRLVSYLIFNAKAFDKQYPHTGKVGKAANLWHRLQNAYLPTNHLHQLLAEEVAAIPLIEKCQDILQTIGKLITIKNL